MPRSHLSWKNSGISVAEYYRDPNIRKRMDEYLGGTGHCGPTAVYVTRCDKLVDLHAARRPEELGHFLKTQKDVARSLWDKQDLLAHLDIEYVNFDFPAEPYLDAERTHSLQVPLVTSVEKVLSGYGIEPFHLATGRGHHFTWRIDRGSSVFRDLRECAHVPEHLYDFYGLEHGPEGESIPGDLAEAYSGLGLVMEYLAHRVRRDRESPGIKVKTFCSPAGIYERGRELLVVDISEYGDPLNTRMIRMPFSLYLKPWEQNVFGDHGEGEHAGLICAVPCAGIDTKELVKSMRDPRRLFELAASHTARIPERSAEMKGLVGDYRSSGTREFHEWYYHTEQCEPEKWPVSYDILPHDLLPVCARKILDTPNDLMLKPVCLEFLIKVLLSLGWHPRHIGGLIRSKYERDHGWGDLWYRYDAGYRADFYSRVICGEVFLGMDRLEAFDCEPLMCYCGCEQQCGEMSKYIGSLRSRREHGKLAGSPFNRLLL